MKKQKSTIMIIAEIANAHEGNFNKAMELVKAASLAGVHAVKFQKFTADELLVTTHPRYRHFKNLEMHEEQWRKLYASAHESGLLFFADVFGVDSFQLVKSLPADGIKIHSSDLSNMHLLKEVSAWQDTLLVSCGGASELDIHRALTVINPHENKQNIFLMHGFQNFPTSLHETNLQRIRTLRDTFSLPVGFMDHVDAEDHFAHILPLLGIAAGATMIEKHLTLDRSQKGIDYYSSFQPEEMRKLVENIRNVEISQGIPDIVFGNEEIQYRKKMKKHPVAAFPLPVGVTITQDAITHKRVDNEAFPLFHESIVGKKTIFPVANGEVITLSKLDVRVGILIIARLDSKRLPNKAILPIKGKPAISYLIERAKLCKNAHAVILCTGDQQRNTPIINVAKHEGIPFFSGDELDVVSRMLGACKQENLDVIVRATGDDIFFSHEYADMAIERLLKTNADYCHNKSIISGSECEVFQVDAIKTIFEFAEDRDNTEYLTYYIENDNFQKTEVEVPSYLKRDVSITLDTHDDFDKVCYVLDNVYRTDRPYTQDELTAFIDKHPDRFPIRKRESGPSLKDTLNCKLSFRRGVHREA